LYTCSQSSYLNRYRRDDRLNVYSHGTQARQSGRTDVVGSAFDTDSFRGHSARQTTLAAARTQCCVDAGRRLPQLTDEHGEFANRRIRTRRNRHRTSCCRHRSPHGVTVALDMPPRRRSHSADETFAQAGYGDASERAPNHLPKHAVPAAPATPDPDDNDPHACQRQQQ
jgi:hypothetical protein